jgi:predicted hotdog family 3-hydroxylacyl-ACP dehydratase
MPDEVMEGNSMEPMDILDLIPQRPPMVMVDRLTEVNGPAAVSVFRLREDTLFVKDGRFQETGLMENMAQTAAAMHGYRARVRGKTVKNGYIGGIKNLVIHDLPAAGETLSTRVVEEHQVMNTSIVRGEVRSGGRLVASCEFKVFMEE